MTGGASSDSGSIHSVGIARPIVIGGDLVGGSASGTAPNFESGFVRARRIASFTLGESLIAGTNDTIGVFANNGAVRADDDIGTVLIKGGIVGNATNPAIISARGKAVPTATSDVAIGSLRVLGRIEWAQILAGVDTGGGDKNADAQIGTVSVGGDWVASSIAAGAVNLGADDAVGGVGPNADNVNFGDAHDAKMSGVPKDTGVSSKITSLTIGGQVLGTTAGVGTDFYGIVAEVVGTREGGRHGYSRPPRSGGTTTSSSASPRLQGPRDLTGGPGRADRQVLPGPTSHLNHRPNVATMTESLFPASPPLRESCHDVRLAATSSPMSARA